MVDTLGRRATGSDRLNGAAGWFAKRSAKASDSCTANHSFERGEQTASIAPHATDNQLSQLRRGKGSDTGTRWTSRSTRVSFAPQVPASFAVNAILVLAARNESMPLHHRVLSDQALVIVEASGVLTDADVLAAQERLRTDPAFERDYRELVDLQRVSSIPDSEERAQVREPSGRPIHRRNAR